MLAPLVLLAAMVVRAAGRNAGAKKAALLLRSSAAGGAPSTSSHRTRCVGAEPGAASAAGLEEFAPCLTSNKGKLSPGKLSGSVTPAIRSNFGEVGLSASKLAGHRPIEG
jgi:hypothetical protein